MIGDTKTPGVTVKKEVSEVTTSVMIVLGERKRKTLLELKDPLSPKSSFVILDIHL